MTAAYTIVTPDYLAHAKTFADSLFKYNPEFTFFICLIGDKSTLQEDFFSPSIILDTTSTEFAEFEEMSKRYSNFQLSCALKPFFAEVLFEKFQLESLVYFDSDILIFNNLSLLKKYLKEYSIIITPHSVDDTPRNDENNFDLMLLNSGVFNAGFFALSNSAETSKFIKWWKHKMLTECYRDVANGRFDDQIWFNFIPIYFERTFILKDAGYNMAIWNMREREIYIQNETFLINKETPLVFFHFTGYNIDEPYVLCRYYHIHTFDSRPDVAPVFKAYRANLRKNRIVLFPKKTGDQYFEQYIAFLNNFIREHNIKSITEISCDDFSLGSRITKDNPSIIYNTCEDCQPVIDYHKSKNESSQVNFIYLNPLEGRIPEADLVIIGNVLQLLKNEEISKVLKNVKHFKHVLVTEHLLQDGLELCHNKDKKPGWYRITERSGVYLDKLPFNVPCKELFSYPADVWVENDTKDDWIEQAAFKKTFLAEVTV